MRFPVVARSLIQTTTDFLILSSDAQILTSLSSQSKSVHFTVLPIGNYV